MSDIVRVLRVIEYVGPRDLVEQQISRSLKNGTHFGHGGVRPPHRVTIKVATVGDYPEVLNQPGGWNGEVGQDYDGSMAQTEQERVQALLRAKDQRVGEEVV